ncbi:unnamed protein product [Rotaria sordida]|uniref:Uncharacterized protein n=1 Tax=Rotaria sordida TaxID=392033 RepID=A0A819PJE3_9BILA|nr:unnamed protein product [Rotaria sordida]CAF4016158.1 unnamed protein product [Rotaria sordida]
MDREFIFCDKLTYEDKLRAKVFAHLISMPVQLKYLLVEKFQLLASNNLRKNALSTVRHVEFNIPSCNHGPNESIDIGKDLTPFLSTYMPHLQTLCLWRPDDFPWTTMKNSFYFNSQYHVIELN